MWSTQVWMMDKFSPMANIILAGRGSSATRDEFHLRSADTRPSCPAATRPPRRSLLRGQTGEAPPSPRYCRRVMITDLHHLLDLPPDAPGPARRLAEHLGNIVRAATAGDAGTAWESALPCRRRPANRACTGRMLVLRAGAGTPIRWQCRVCSDVGVISNWEDSPFDLRRRGLIVAKPGNEIVIEYATAAALRELRLLDADCQRVVFRIRGEDYGAVLSAAEDELEELVGAVAAEANHESRPSRRKRLDAVLNALSC